LHRLIIAVFPGEVQFDLTTKRFLSYVSYLCTKSTNFWWGSVNICSCFRFKL